MGTNNIEPPDKALVDEYVLHGPRAMLGRLRQLQDENAQQQSFIERQHVQIEALEKRLGALEEAQQVLSDHIMQLNKGEPVAATPWAKERIEVLAGLLGHYTTGPSGGRDGVSLEAVKKFEALFPKEKSVWSGEDPLTTNGETN